MNLLDAMRYLVALDEHRHFGRAAQACHITQPALSNAIRALEAEFGIAIVRRSRQYEGLTAEGRTLLASAHRMLHEHEVLRQELRAERHDPRGQLTIGAVPTAMPVAALFGARLRALHPGIVPVVRSLSSAEIEAGIETLGLDMAFGYSDRLARREGRLVILRQYDEKYYLLRRVPRPRARRASRVGAPMRWSDAAAEPLCMLSAEMHNRAVVDAAFAAAGARIVPAIETNAVMMLVLAVLAGDVCSVVPGTLLELALSYPDLEVVPLVEPVVCTPVGLLTSGGERRSLAQQCALALARDADWLALAGAQSSPPAR